jgi:drug/metabolite transporter (DMT)-like permease
MVWFILASCSALLSAAAAIIQKKVLLRAHALEFSFLVSLIIMVLSMYVPLTMDITAIPQSTLLIILGKSVLGGLAFLLVMMALERNQISSVLPLLGLTPAVTACVSFLATGEVLTGWEWIGIGLVVAGTYLLERRPAGNSFSFLSVPRLPTSHYYIIGALGLFAVSSVADKLLVTGYKTDPRVVLVYQHIVYCVIFGVLLRVRRIPARLVLQKGREHLPFLVAISALTIAYRFTQLEATKDAPVALVLAVKRTSILYASLLGGKLFSDDRLGVKVAGASLIVASGFVILRNVS